MELFNYKGALDINYARIQHLDTLQLNFNNKTVLETGCGGRGDITRYLLSKHAIVTLNDYRKDNIMELLKSIQKKLDFNTWDLNQPFQLDKKYDIIVCYGTLYHLNNPEQAIENFANSCNEFLVLSTITNGTNDESINITPELISSSNQAGDGYGCRPGRMFLYNTLQKYFKYVYLIKTQPRNQEFPLKFPADPKLNARNVFIGSHIKIERDLLVEELINEFEY